MTGRKRINHPLNLFLGLVFMLLACSGSKKAAEQSMDESDMEVIVQESQASWPDWQQDRLEALLDPKGWFSLIGLHWLEEGQTTLGSANSSTIQLGSQFPSHIGTYIKNDHTIEFNCHPDLPILLNGRKTDSIRIMMQTNSFQEMELDHLAWHLIRRNDRYGVRLKDTSIPSRIRISAIPYFDFNPDLIFKAKVIPTSQQDSIDIVNVLGMETRYHIADQLSFNYQGETYRLNALGQEGQDYFVIISDETSAFSTYGGGRYLYVSRTGSDEVILDFNRAINPPCVFTDYATCPLPPKSNHLPFKVTAGEKKWNH